MTGQELLDKWKDGQVGGTGRGRRELRAEIDRLVPVHSRPRCVGCGEALVLDVSMIWNIGLDEEVPHRDERGRLITGRVTKVGLDATGNGITFHYWTGRLGKDGRGLFHSYRCGFDYAVKYTKAKRQRNFDDIVKEGGTS